MRMPKKLLIPICALAVLTAASWPVLGQNKAGQSQASAHKQIVKLMDEHDMTLAKAQEAAEKESGGRAVKVSADLDGEKLVFTVQCSIGDDLKPVSIDHNGKATIRGKKDDAKDKKKDEKKPEEGGGDTPRKGGNPRQP